MQTIRDNGQLGSALVALRAGGMRVLMGGPNVVLGGSHSGNVSALDLATGEPLWAFAFQRALPGSLGSFGPYLLAFTTAGPVYILDAKTGYPFKKWRGTTGFLAPVERGSSRLYAISNYGELFGLKLGY